MSMEAFMVVFVTFSAGTGWRARFNPVDNPLTSFEFDVVIGADGRRNTLKGRRETTTS